MATKRLRYILTALLLVAALSLAASLAFAQSGPAGAPPIGPGAISYQGRVTVNGEPYDGNGYFMFAIVDSQGNYTWNSDIIVQAQGADQQIGAPQNPISLPVKNGLFSVRLGAAPLMPPIPPDAVADPDSALRVWFGADPNNLTQLPDRPFSAAPWSLVADTLDGFDSGDFALANHDHWGETWSGGGTGLELQSSDGWGLDVSTQSGANFATAVRGKAESSSGRTVGVWGVNESSSDEAIGVWGQANASSGKTYGVYGQNSSTTDGAAGVFGWAQGNSGAVYGVKGQSNSQFGIGVYGFNKDSVGVKGESETWIGVYGVRGSQSLKAPLAGAGVWGDSSEAFGVFGASDNAAGVFGTGSITGTVGFATNNTGTTYGVYGRSYSDDGYGVFGQGAENGVGVRGESVAGEGVVGFSASGVGVSGYGWFFGNAGKFENVTTVTPTVIIQNANDTGPALVVTGTTTIRAGVNATGEAVLTVFNDRDGGDGLRGVGGATGVVGESYLQNGIGVYGGAQAESGDNVGVYGSSSSPDGTGVYGNNMRGGFAGRFVGQKAEPATLEGHIVTIENLATGNAGADGLAIHMKGESDKPGGNVNFITFFSGSNDTAVGAIEGNGSGGVVYKSGGADFAELLPAVDGLEPGDVVVIGADGKLVRSSKANQTNVAGVYSTAPAFLGGMTADMEKVEARDDAAASDRAPIAVVGIVPVKVSAENGAIRPGDLLTASNTPGHAMKADPVNVGGVEFYRPGTIIGKALESLDKGTGVIRVLITLH